MIKLTLLALGAFSGLSSVQAFIGYDIEMYNPPCAYACFSALSSNALACSEIMEMDGHAHAMSSSDCRAQDSAWLTSLAYCIQSRCEPFGVPTSKLESYWEKESTKSAGLVKPKWSYGASLANIQETPTLEAEEEGTMNFTALSADDKWFLQWNTMDSFARSEYVTATYSIAVLVAGFGLPIVLTLLGYLPFMHRFSSKLKPYIIYPALLGKRHVEPLPYSAGNAPTIGQALYVFFMVILTTILSSVTFKAAQPNAWYENAYQEVMNYVMLRTGMIAFGLLPLTILFAGRNNVLLWLSNWSHATYLLLHRWIARIFGLLVILHSILALHLYKDTGAYPEEEKLDYWIWGSVGTVAVSIMLIISGLYVRKRQYELFLISHIVLAIFVIAGCWYHIKYRFGSKWGYEKWIYAAMAVWAFDRIWRVLRVVKNGARRAVVTDLGSIVRVDVEGVRWSGRPGQHAYAYFPTLKPMRPWENHPFSVIPTALLRGQHRGSTLIATHDDPEKHSIPSSSSSSLAQHKGSAGLTFFIRKSAGLTKALITHSSLLTFIDGPYTNTPSAPITACDRVLLIGGGVGITGLLPWVTQHSNVRVAWSVRHEAEGLVNALRPVIASRLLGAEDVDVRIGSRLDVEALLEEEADRKSVV